MIPELDLQLQVVIKALQDTVMPAVDPAQRMAVEQLGLSIATLAMVRTRLPFLAAREWQDVSDAVAMAKAAGVTGLSAQIAEGERLLAVVCPVPGALNEARRAILSALSESVTTAPDGEIDALMHAVIAGSKPATDLARAWSKPAGFEPDPGDVPELETMLAR